MRAFAALSLAVFAAIGIGVGVIASASASGNGASMQMMALPTGLGSRQIAAGPTGVVVYGTVGSNGRCMATTLGRSATFSKLEPIPESHPTTTVSICGEPVAPHVWVLPSPRRGTYDVAIRLVLENARTGRFHDGPVVANISTWGWSHDGQPVAGDGSVWLYDDESKPMSILQLSESTGRVIDRVPLPGLGYDPVTAADDDGLWIAPSQGWSEYGRGNAPLYRIAPSSHAAIVAYRGGSAIQWLTASGQDVWADVVGPVPTLTQTIWRFNGPSAKVDFATPGRLLPGPEGAGTGYAVVGDLTDGLFTLKGMLSAPFEGDACTGSVEVIGIDPNSGAQRVVDTFSVRVTTPWISCRNESLFAPRQAVVTDGTLSFLWDVTRSSELDFTTLRQLAIAP